METETPLMLAMVGCVALLTYLALTKTICFRYSFPAIDDTIDYDIQQRLQRTAAKVVHILTLQHSEKAMAHHQIVGRRYDGCMDAWIDRRLMIGFPVTLDGFVTTSKIQLFHCVFVFI